MYALIELEAWALLSSAGVARTKVEIKRLNSNKNGIKRLTKSTLPQQHPIEFRAGKSIDHLALHDDGASGGIVQTLTQRVKHRAYINNERQPWPDHGH